MFTLVTVVKLHKEDQRKRVHDRPNQNKTSNNISVVVKKFRQCFSKVKTLWSLELYLEHDIVLPPIVLWGVLQSNIHFFSYNMVILFYLPG